MGALEHEVDDPPGSEPGGFTATCRLCYAACVTSDTKAIIGTIVGTGLVLGGLLATQIANVNASLNARVDDARAGLAAQIAGLSARVDEIRADLRAVRTRLRNVEIAFGRVDQRLSTIERVVLPGPPASE